MLSREKPGPSRALEREIKLRRSIRQVKKYSADEAGQNNTLQRSLSERNLSKVLMRCYQNQRGSNSHSNNSDSRSNNTNRSNNNNYDHYNHQVEPNGKADFGGMKVGDRVVSINGVSTNDVFHSEALAAVKRANTTLNMGLHRPDTATENVQRPTKIDLNRNETSHSHINGAISQSAAPLSAPKSPVKANPAIWSPPNGETKTTSSVSSNEGVEQTAALQYNEFYEPRSAKPVSIGSWNDRTYSNDNWATDIIDAAVRTPAPISLVDTGSRDARFKSESSAAAEREPSPPPDNRSSTLPRKLGQRKDSDRGNMTSYDDRARTLPGKKQSANVVPNWYKQMYKEMHSSMEGESHLTRLLTSDAARGAFRKYDGATSPNNTRSQSPVEKQRPASMHFRTHSDDNVFTSNTTEPARANVSVRGLKSTYMEKVSQDGGQPPKLTRQEERQKRHSVHSTWYRQIQKGGEIPMTGLRNQELEATTTPTVRQFSKEEGDKPNKPSTLAGGKTYQRLEKELGTDEEKKKRFEYNNPPDFLELRKRAEAEGRLQEDKERERRLIEEERERRLKEEGERKKSYEMERDKQRQMEEERLQRLAEDRRRRLEVEKRHQDMERSRAEERRRIEEERYRQEQERFLKEQQRLEEQRRLEEEKRREQERTRMELERLQIEEKKKLAAKEQQQTIVNGDSIVGHAKALYSFQPQSSAELAFKKGEIVKILRQIDDNWYEGEIRGYIGILPVSYVEVFKEKAPPALQVEEGLAKAKYSFKAESPKELSFRKADMITLLRKVDANWYEGEIGDKIGIFPSSYVEVVREPKVLGKVEVNSPPHIIEEAVSFRENHVVESLPPQSAPNGHSAAPSEKYKVLFGYAPTNEDEIELREGDIVDVVEKCDDGWYVGTVVGTSMLGIFPGNYVSKI